MKKLNELNIKVELFTDINMHLMIEKRMRGGICTIMKKFAKKNENTHILYIDANNLYGWTMVQPLLNGNFKWIDNITNFTTNFIL